MAVPWMRLLDTAIGVVSLARGRREPAPGNPSQELEAGGRMFGGLEARLAGVVVAALKEAFDRDTRRLELEREQLEAERRRAEQALRLELLRQAGDRELGRLRLTAGVAVVSFLGTLFFSARLMGGPIVARVLLGGGWLFLLVALALSFTGQSAVARAIERADQSSAFSSAGEVAPWLIVIGLAIVGIAVLIA